MITIINGGELRKKLNEYILVLHCAFICHGLMLSTLEIKILLIYGP